MSATIKLPVDCAGAKLHRPVGYSYCVGFLSVTDDIKRRITDGDGATLIKRQAISYGMRTPRGDGIARVLAGLTSFDEVLRSTPDDFEIV